MMNINNIVNVNDMRKNDNIFKKKSYMKLKNIETISYANMITSIFNIENYAQIDTASFMKRTTSQLMREISSQNKSKIEKKLLYRNTI